MRLARTFVEQFRQPDAHLGYLAAGTTMGQWLSAPMLIIGVVLIVHALMRDKTPPEAPRAAQKDPGRKGQEERSGVSGLATLLRGRIAAAGPITVAEYMAEALGHPEHGYYMRRDPFGRSGDFTTAPEVSQMFGELIGLWCRVVWETMGRPAPVNLVELGPGRGTLMADALRAATRSPGGAGVRRRASPPHGGDQPGAA